MTTGYATRSDLTTLVNLVRVALGDPNAPLEAQRAAEQPNLFSQPPAQKHSETSRDAAKEIEPHAGNLRAHVLAWIEKHGPCTDEAIALGTGLNPSTASI